MLSLHFLRMIFSAEDARDSVNAIDDDGDVQSVCNAFVDERFSCGGLL